MLKMCLKLLRQRLRKLHKNGEISIYLSLVFTLIISLLLTVITASRGAALQVVYECAVESALLSAFGEYNRELLDRYDVFFIDLSYLSNSPDPTNLEARLNEYFDDNFHPENGTSFLFYSDILDVTDTNVSLKEYEIATDRFGEPFARQVAEYMSNLVGISDVKDMLNTMSVWDSYNLSTSGFDEIRESTKQKIINYDTETWEQTHIKERLFTIMYPKSEMIILLGEDFFNLSKETIVLEDTLLIRNKQHGTGPVTEFELEPAQKIYFIEYIINKMGSYIDQKEESKLKYEAEYIIIGSDSDFNNIQTYIQMLYVTRALEDYISLNMATDKVDNVRAVAELLSAFIKIPEPVITQAILVGWAALEGITDIHDLIKGERVPLIKTSSQINVSLQGLLNQLSGNVEIPEETVDNLGDVESEIPNITLSYNDYLRIFLYMIPNIVETYRTMDIVEQNLRKSGTGNEYFRFDVCADKIKAVFAIETGFDFRYVSEKRYSYF